MTIAETLIADFDEEVVTTRRVLAAIPDQHLDWKPHEKSMSLGQLAGHICEAPGWTRSMIEPEFDFAAVARDYTPFVPKSREALLATFAEKIASFHETFSGRDDAFMTANWRMKNGDVVFLSAPREKAVRQTVVHHMIHHRGQLTVYLRLLDIPVPSTYGPSADEQPPGT